jgi:pimeloyl-ACP methyl ester carboxylesterase
VVRSALTSTPSSTSPPGKYATGYLPGSCSRTTSSPSAIHAHAASLLLDYLHNDWRDVLPRITVPALVLGGEASFLSPSVAPEVAARIPGARSRVFSERERGSHLVFWENPAVFDSVVARFLDGDDT